MIVANQKKKEHIVEYILYMMQIQDLLRAYKFSLEIIEKEIINKYEVSKSEKSEIKNWYSNLIISMNTEGIKEKGNLKIIEDLFIILDSIHKKVLKSKELYPDYSDAYSKASDNIKAYKAKSLLKTENEIKICITALYNLLLLKHKNIQINPETMEAMKTFGKLMALLTKLYHNEESK